MPANALRSFTCPGPGLGSAASSMRMSSLP